MVLSNRTVSLVGHSLGADQLMTTLVRNDVAADLFVSLDLSAGNFLNDNETVERTSKIKLVIGFYQTNGIPGGNKIDSKNPNTKVVDFKVDSTHMKIDNNFGAAAAELVR